MNNFLQKLKILTWIVISISLFYLVFNIAFPILIKLIVGLVASFFLIHSLDLIDKLNHYGKYKDN